MVFLPGAKRWFAVHSPATVTESAMAQSDGAIGFAYVNARRNDGGN